MACGRFKLCATAYPRIQNTITDQIIIIIKLIIIIIIIIINFRGTLTHTIRGSAGIAATALSEGGGAVCINVTSAVCDRPCKIITSLSTRSVTGAVRHG